jgi:hypothetical protein
MTETLAKLRRSFHENLDLPKGENPKVLVCGPTNASVNQAGTKTIRDFQKDGVNTDGYIVRI